MRDVVFTPFAKAPESAGLFLDFDGTISEIVSLPSDARPIAGARDLLVALAEKLAVVAVVSGRSAHELLEWLGPEIEIWGVHGSERTLDGAVVAADEAAAHRELIARVRAEAEAQVADAGLPGVLVEDKRSMLTLHWRAAVGSERAEAVLEELAARLADRHGLTIARGRKSLELRPPVNFSKGTVVLTRAREAGLKAAAFMGDDRVDLAGFDALDVLSEEGVATARIAVASPEAPPELLDRADLVVAGPFGVVELLRGLLDRAGQS